MLQFNVVHRFIFFFLQGYPEAEFFFLINASVAMLISLLGLMSPFRLTSFTVGRLFNKDIVGAPRRGGFYGLFFIFCLGLFVSYVSKLGGSPLYMLLIGGISPDDLVAVRMEANAGKQGLIYGMGLRFFMPVLFLMAIARLSYWHTGSRFFGLFSIAIPFLYVAWALDKTPVVSLFVMLLIYFLLYRKRLVWCVRNSRVDIKKRFLKRIRKVNRLLLAFTLCVFIYPIFIFSKLPAGELGFEYILSHIFSRLFIIPSINSYNAIELFKSSLEFTYFLDVNSYSALIDKEPINLSFLISEYRGMGAENYSPPAAVGNFYAQAGLIGVMAGVVVATLCFQAMEWLILSLKSPEMLRISLYVVLMFGAFRFSWANFHTLLATETVFPCLIMLLIGRLFVKKRASL